MCVCIRRTGTVCVCVRAYIGTVRQDVCCCSYRSSPEGQHTGPHSVADMLELHISRQLVSLHVLLA